MMSCHSIFDPDPPTYNLYFVVTKSWFPLLPYVRDVIYGRTLTLKVKSVLIGEVFPAFAPLKLDSTEADVVRGLGVRAVVPGLTV